MFCGKCGSKLTVGIEFCQFCGAKVSQLSLPLSDGVNENVLKKTKKRKNVLIFSIVLSLIFFITCGIVGNMVINDPAKKIIDSLERQEYARAITIFEENFSGRDKRKLTERLQAHLDILLEEFKLSKKDYLELQNELATIREMGIFVLSDKFSDISDQASILNRTRNNIEDSKKFLQTGDYMSAIEILSSELDNALENEEILEEYNRTINLYVSDCIGKLDGFIENRDFKEALDFLEIGLGILPKQEALLNEKNRLRTAMTVVDDASLFSKSELDKLVLLIKDIQAKYEMDVSVVTTRDTEGKDIKNFADDFYDQKGYGFGSDYTGLLLAIDAETRKFAISTLGKCISDFDNIEMQSLLSEFTAEAKKDHYFETVKMFLKLVERYKD